MGGEPLREQGEGSLGVDRFLLRLAAPGGMPRHVSIWGKIKSADAFLQWEDTGVIKSFRDSGTEDIFNRVNSKEARRA